MKLNPKRYFAILVMTVLSASLSVAFILVSAIIELAIDTPTHWVGWFYIALFGCIGVIWLLCTLLAAFIMNHQDKVRTLSEKKSIQRSVAFIKFSEDRDALNTELHKYLTGKGFKMMAYNGEAVYCKGKSILSPGKYIKFQFVKGGVDLEAFVTNFALKQSYLEGAANITTKRSLKYIFNDIIDIIEKY